jgi:uncharacterized protein YdaU (DUF1376 family)
MENEKNVPAFQCYPADYLADVKVQMLSSAQEGIYWRLVCYCWREGSLPADGKAIARLCKPDATAIDIAHVMAELFYTVDGRLYHKRLEKERGKQVDRHNKLSESGKLGAQKRWGNKDSHPNGPAIATPMATPMANHSSSSSSSSSISTHTHRCKISEEEKAGLIKKWTATTVDYYLIQVRNYCEAKNPNFENFAAYVDLWIETDQKKNKGLFKSKIPDKPVSEKKLPAYQVITKAEQDQKLGNVADAMTPKNKSLIDNFLRNPKNPEGAD